MNDYQNKCEPVYVNDGAWWLGRLIACVERMQELSVWGSESSDRGTIYGKVISLVRNDPLTAMDKLGDMYEKVYKKGALFSGDKLTRGVAWKVNHAYQDVLARLSNFHFPGHLTRQECGKVILGKVYQTSQFWEKKESDTKDTGTAKA